MKKAEDYVTELQRDMLEASAKTDLQIINDAKMIRRLIKRLHGYGPLGTEAAAIMLTQLDTVRDIVQQHQRSYEEWLGSIGEERHRRDRMMEVSYLANEVGEDDAIHDIKLV